MSDFIRWQENWALEIPYLDQQHLELVEQINRIAQTVASERSTPAHRADAGRQAAASGVDDERCAEVPAQSRLICDQVEELIAQTREHFREEETLMQRLSYPGFQEHKREHGILLAELVDLARQVRQGAEQMGLGTLTALKHWLIVHIVTSDQAYADYYHHYGPSIEKAASAGDSGEHPSAAGWRSDAGPAVPRVSNGN